MNIGAVPTWDLSDRLHKALRVSGLSAQELAAQLGIHRNSISNYTSGRVAPDRRTLIAWAMATGVRLDWLIDGTEPTDGPDGGGNQVTREYGRLQGAQVIELGQLAA